MNFAHIHLLLNHIPVIGTIMGFGLFLASFFGKNNDLRRSSLIIFAVVALLTIPTFLIGFGAQDEIKGLPGVSDVLIVRHEGAAMLSLWFMLITGALALVGLWHCHRHARPARWNLSAILFFSLLTVVLMARTGNTGGDIRHPEVWEGAEATGATVTEGTIGSILHVFEPNPDKFTHAMISSKWWWAFLMDLHYIGLALLIGTVGILDIRVMGFVKQLPVAPLHGFVPWALAGLGINIVTGLLAFIGMPLSYTYTSAFWLKMLALLLLGLNVAVFYLTPVFEGVERLQKGEDAPPFAKFIAGSSLFLCFAIIILGRYIQLLEGTISSTSK
jgi:uncharacterized membrane protein